MTTGSHDSPTGSHPATIPYIGGQPDSLPTAPLIRGPKPTTATFIRSEIQSPESQNTRLEDTQIKPWIPWLIWAIVALVVLVGIVIAIASAITRN